MLRRNGPVIKPWSLVRKTSENLMGSLQGGGANVCEKCAIFDWCLTLSRKQNINTGVKDIHRTLARNLAKRRWIFGPLSVLPVCPVPYVTLVYCGQTVGWIKMPLSMEVGIGPGDFVLDGDSAPSPDKRGTPAPSFRPMSVVTKRLDGSRYATWYGGRPRSRPHCVSLDGDPAPPPPTEKGTAVPHFSIHVYCGQTVARLGNC